MNKPTSLETADSSGTGLAALSDEFPWPQQKPDAPVSSWAWGIAGEEMLRSFLPADAAIVLEIGTLLGGSARFFAELCPDAHLICVDPWFDVNAETDRPFLKHTPELANFVTGRQDGLYDVFLASNWGLRHRLIPVRGFSPDMLAHVHRHGVQPAVVYVDGSHVYEDVLSDLATARSLFPNAVLCGDDWSWPGVQHAVTYFQKYRGDTLHTSRNTWLIEASGRQQRFNAPSAIARDRGELRRNKDA